MHHIDTYMRPIKSCLQCIPPPNIGKKLVILQCSASCGSGEMFRNVTCVDSANTSLVLDSDLCNIEAKPSEAETCIHSTCTKWIAGDWKPVSKI